MSLNPKQTCDTILKKPAGRQHNAISHGIFAEILMEGHAFQESEAAYQRLLEGLRAAIKPNTPLEHVLVEKLAFLYLRLSRLYKADARIAPRMFESITRGLVEDEPHVFKEYKFEKEIAIVRKELSPELLLRRANNRSDPNSVGASPTHTHWRGSSSAGQGGHQLGVGRPTRAPGNSARGKFS
jgi:hypothetical protein